MSFWNELPFYQLLNILTTQFQKWNADQRPQEIYNQFNTTRFESPDHQLGMNLPLNWTNFNLNNTYKVALKQMRKQSYSPHPLQQDCRGHINIQSVTPSARTK